MNNMYKEGEIKCFDKHVEVHIFRRMFQTLFAMNLSPRTFFERQTDNYVVYRQFNG